MKKLSLLIGTLGGATAGYLLSNKKLREQLSKVKDADEAAKLLGKHLQKDGKKLAKQVQEFVQSDEIQDNLEAAKEFTKKKISGAGKQVSKKAKSTAKKTVKAAKGKAKAAVSRKKAPTKKKAAKKTAKKKKA